MTIMVFWVDPNEDGAPFCAEFGENLLTQALECTEQRRKEGMTHVCISSQQSNSVGQPGVASIENGKTPDGHAYEWSKAHRAGAARRGRKT